jgi:NhaP-type Na+/H+ or K+/H+ antiporter
LILLGMTAMWLATGLLVWDFARTPSVLHALVTGACVTTMDPVLSAVIVKGKFADHNIPKDPQNLIIAESDTNDGPGYPFLYFCTLPHKLGGLGRHAGGAGDSMGL